MTQRKPALLGRLAVQLKMIDPGQLAQATAAQDQAPDKNFGQILVDLGYVNPKQLQKLMGVQRDLVEKHRAKKAAEAGAAAPAAAPAAPDAAAAKKARVLATAAQAARQAAPVDQATVEALREPPAAAARPASPADAAPPAPQAPAPAPPPAAAPVVQAQAPAQQPAPQAAQVAADPDAKPSLELVLPPSDPNHLSRLEQILREGVAAGASDIHIHSGGPLNYRLGGELVKQGGEVLERDVVEGLVAATLTPEQQQEVCHHGEIDFCFALEGVGRFRANAYRQQRGFDVVYRSIPQEPPTLAELGLPAELAKFTNYHQGMVLLTGPAGCGKSSTLAALVNQINEERDEHILTVEDPIEVVHPSKNCLVNQRHAGRHTGSFARALQGALREDPDIIVIGELRDLETISLAMTAAETGHFVLATLHTNNAVRTINRMIGAFPSNEQAQVRTMLSESLRAVVSQRLVPKADDSGRVPALEVLVINKAIGNLIRDEKTVQIRSAIQTGRAHGMMLLEQSLNDLVADGTISRETALRYAEEEKLITAGR